MTRDATTDTLLTMVEMTESLNALFWLYLELSMRIWCVFGADQFIYANF